MAAADDAKPQYNLKNPAVKRILQEVKEMRRDPSRDYSSMPLEEDIFEWQFAIHGPRDTEFEGGIYHGRIILPAEYPFKPPAFMLLSPSGRFEVQSKICLSISQHHPEHWQPSWSIRTALVALIAFLPTKPDGALGSLDYTKEERRMLAIKSRLAPPKFGSPACQRVIDELHQQMLETAPPIPDIQRVSKSSPSPDMVQRGKSGVEEEVTRAAEIASGPGVTRESGPLVGPADDIRPQVDPCHSALAAGLPPPTKEQLLDAGCAIETRHAALCTGMSNTSPMPTQPDLPHECQVMPALATGAQMVLAKQQPSDRALTCLAAALAVAIAALLLRKVLKAYGVVE